MKKTLSFLLVICMVLSMFPATVAFAESDPAQLPSCPRCEYTISYDNECPDCGDWEYCPRCYYCYWCGFEGAHVTVHYGCDISYTVVIPEDIIIPSYEEPGVGNVSIQNAMLSSRSTLKVYITGDAYKAAQNAWELNERNNGNKLYYVILSEDAELVPESLVMAVGAGEAWNRSITQELLFALTEEPVHAGNYASQVTFFVEIDVPGPLLDTPYMYMYDESTGDTTAAVFKKDGTLLWFDTDWYVAPPRSARISNTPAVVESGELYLKTVSTWQYDASTRIVKDVENNSYYQMNETFTEMYPMGIPKSSSFDTSDLQPIYGVAYVARGHEQAMTDGQTYEADNGTIALKFDDQNTTAIMQGFDADGVLQTMRYENIQWSGYGHIGEIDVDNRFLVSMDGDAVILYSYGWNAVFTPAVEETYEDGLVPGLYETGAIDKYLNGEDVSDMLLMSWKQMLAAGYVFIEEGAAYMHQDWASEEIYLEELDLYLTNSWANGDLFFPNNENVQALCDFNSCYLTGVYVPESIQYINSFACCPYLTTAYLDGNITELFDTFDFCVQLKNVKLPDTLEILDGGFYYCVSLTELELPDSLQYIGNYTFEGCGITELDLNNVSTLGEGLFYASNIQSVEIPKNVTDIEGNIFVESNTKWTVAEENPIFKNLDGCLVNIETGVILTGSPDGNIPNDNRVHQIGDEAYYDGTFNTIDIPANISYIGWCAFCNCDNLTSVTIPGTVQSIDGSAFASCDNLTSVEMLHGVKEIEDDAFAYNPKLTTIIVPSSVTYCNTSAFYETAVSSLTLYGVSSTLGANTLRLTTLESLVLPDGIKAVAASAFARCTNLTTVTLGHSISTIQPGAFAESVTTIIYEGTKQEANNNIETNWDLPASVTTIQCSDGLLCLEHTGGTADCVNKAVCEVCNVSYGKLSQIHDIQGTECVLCGQEGLKFETAHYPYDSAPEGVLLGTWNFEGAKGVRITVIYETDNHVEDYIAITQGDDWQSLDERRLYMYTQSTDSLNGSATWAYIEDFQSGHFGGQSINGTITRTQYMRGWNAGSVVWVANETANNEYGATIIVIPVY